jgi:hypothetical protein
LLEGVERIVFAPAVAERKRPPMFGPVDLASDRIKAWHASAPSDGFEWSVYLSSEISVSGIGHLWHRGELVEQDDLLPGFWRQQLSRTDTPSFSIEHESRLPERVEERRCVPAPTWGWNNYGHFLLDGLPRLLAARTLFGEELAYLFRADTPEWVLGICDVVGIGAERRVVFDAATERVRLVSGVYPAYGRQSIIHPALSAMLDTGGERRTGARIFLTRRDLSDRQKRARHCLNEDELAEIATTEFGFQQVAPEALPWVDQVRLFRTSAVIAGLVGSALHTSIFSDHKLKMAWVGFNAMAQLQICSFRSQPFGIYDEGVVAKAGYSVDTEKFRCLLAAL